MKNRLRAEAAARDRERPRLEAQPPVAAKVVSVDLDTSLAYCEIPGGLIVPIPAHGGWLGGAVGDYVMLQANGGDYILYGARHLTSGEVTSAVDNSDKGWGLGADGILRARGGYFEGDVVARSFNARTQDNLIPFPYAGWEVASSNITIVSYLANGVRVRRENFVGAVEVYSPWIMVPSLDIRYMARADFRTVDAASGAQNPRSAIVNQKIWLQTDSPSAPDILVSNTYRTFFPTQVVDASFVPFDATMMRFKYRADNVLVGREIDILLPRVAAANYFSGGQIYQDDPGGVSQPVLDARGLIADGVPITGPWVEFTPAWTHGSPPAPFTGFAVATNRYRRIGQTVELFIHAVSGGVLGADPMEYQLPFRARNNDINTTEQQIGTAKFLQNGVRHWLGVCYIQQAGGIRLRFAHGGAGNFGRISAFDPFGWGAGDTLSAHITYEIDPQ